ncbi:hypothetical protein FUAX_05960 [Fulvitalea axinellae]|uniref:Protein SirB1 N-terminal domain-containing protein n=1 Tax=Fulvitalea axinellae TaxID=1182444 RepID=A0AAU9D158_9BACT|nr:hypothetical protein FUAX_05960 [Fulvitalea axinellae]
MKDSELNALVTLLDDEDTEVTEIAEDRLMRMGADALPILEHRWENTDDYLLQTRLEELIERIRLNDLETELRFWADMESEDLLKGMWIISRSAYPDYPLEKLRADFAQMYHEAWTQVGIHGNAIDQVKQLNDYLFRLKGFGPNETDFHLPANSLINRVLETRRGNPITLCVIYLLIAQKLGLPVFGVNLPNIFVLMYRSEVRDFYINAFNKGVIFMREDLEEYVSQLPITTQENFFEPCGNLEIIARCLRNLVVAYGKTHESRARQLKRMLDIVSAYA